MFDHVTIRVADRTASEAFYETVLRTLGVERTYTGEELVEWQDFSLAPADAEHPVTRRLHGNSAEAVHHGSLRSRGDVDHLWIRVADVAAAKRFYATVAPVAGFELPRRVGLRRNGQIPCAHRNEVSGLREFDRAAAAGCA